MARKKKTDESQIEKEVKASKAKQKAEAPKESIPQDTPQVVKQASEGQKEDLKETPEQSPNDTEEAYEKPLQEESVIIEEELTQEQESAQNESEEVVEEVVEESKPKPEPVLFDSWGREIPTVTLCLEDVDFNSLISRVVQAGNYQAELNPTKEIKIHGVPFQIHLLMSQEAFERYQMERDHIQYSEGESYLKLTVKSVDRKKFFENLLKASAKAFLAPNTGTFKTPEFRATLLTRQPVEGSLNVIVGQDKITYSQDELKSFDIKELKVIGSWYNISVKSKEAFIKAILEKQG